MSLNLSNGFIGTVYVATGDGSFNQRNGDSGSTFLAASTPALDMVDSSPQNQKDINRRDLDLPSVGQLWFSYRYYQFITGGGKESVVYLLNADPSGDKNHQTPFCVSRRWAMNL